MDSVNYKRTTKGGYRDNLKDFINKTLKEKQITAYELSRILNLNETVIPSFLKDKTKTLNSKAVVDLADFMEVSLDQVVGRDYQTNTKKIVSKIDSQNKTPDFLTNISTLDQKEILSIRETQKKFNHPSLTPNQEKKEAESKKVKSFVDLINQQRKNNNNKGPFR